MPDTITDTKVPDEIKRFLEIMTPFQKKYAEYRARGLKQYDAAKKAGSQAKDRATLGRVGYNAEQEVGVKEYINYLMEQRARAAMVDNIEIVEKLRRVYDEALADGKYSDANKAMELLGNMIGAFSTKNAGKADQSESSSSNKNNVGAFKEGGETVTERMKVLKGLIGDQQ